MFETELEPEQGAPVLPVRNVYSVGILLATDRDFVGASGLEKN